MMILNHDFKSEITHIETFLISQRATLASPTHHSRNQEKSLFLFKF